MQKIKNSILLKILLSLLIVSIIPLLISGFLMINTYQGFMDRYLIEDIGGMALQKFVLTQQNITIQAGLIVFLVLVLVIFISVLISRNIVRPIRKLSEAAKRVAAGDFDIKLDIKSGDEIDKLAMVFNQMVKDLKQSNQKIGETNIKLETAKKDLEIKVAELEKSEKSILKAFAELNLTKKKLETEGEKAAAIIANLVDPIIVLNKERKINLFNPSAQKILGLSAADLNNQLGGNDLSMQNFKKIIKKNYKVKIGKELKTGELREEITINYDDQDLTYKVITAQVVDSKNEFLGSMKIFYDLTREKMIDKLKSEFISIAAHQLRTPLSAIKWAIKMTLDGDVGKLNKDQKKLLNKGYVSNERMIELVNDMLNVSRIEEGHFGYSFDKYNFDQVFNIAIESLDHQIKDRHIKFILRKHKKLPLVRMDKNKMILVLQNLLENAVRYTPEYGTIEAVIEANKKFLKVNIKDNGVGILKNEQHKVFTKFFRAENVIRMQTDGSGLGLFIVKNIIKKHGGDITFDSEEGKGTEFIFTLPLD